MKIKKLYVLLLMMILLIISCKTTGSRKKNAKQYPEFNYSSYEKMKLEDVAGIYRRDHPVDEPGMAIYNKKICFEYKLESYPDKKNDGKYAGDINFISRIFGAPEGYLGYANEIETNGNKLLFIYQNVLMPGILRDVKIGDSIDIYALFVYYNSFDKRYVLLISAFKTEEDKQKELIK